MDLKTRARSLPRRALRRFVRLAGHDLVAGNFYSPVPHLETLPGNIFERRSPMDGINIDMPSGLQLLADLGPTLSEFEAPPGFRWDNPMYNYVDADVLYAMVRHLRPRRVIELGSGNSSLIIAAALRRNRAEGQGCDYTAYDPYATPLVDSVEGMTLRRVSAADVPLASFVALEPGDLLFIDTTHTVKMGGEVNRIVLEVLPHVRAGVTVHIHDVFLPYEYPQQFLARGLVWSEQYLLQAYLCENPGWRVLLPLFGLLRDYPAELERLVPSYRPDAGPAGFWIERVDAPR